jgi:hypothetical protein
LSICHHIVQRHGGRMWADSPGEGQGTSVQVWLPLRAAIVRPTRASAPSRASRAPARSPAAGRRR